MSSYLAGLRAKIGHDLLLLPAVAVVLRDPGGRLLLVRDRDTGTWSLPAGAIEPSESPIEAARRELLEETGVECASLRLVAGLGGDEFRHTYPNGDVVQYSIFVFQGSASSIMVPGPLDGGEVMEAGFHGRDAVPKLNWPYPEDVLWATAEPVQGGSPGAPAPRVRIP
jgi:8-oxo-dGTP pyrophosphatase MutT (NUDIX family)